MGNGGARNMNLKIVKIKREFLWLIARFWRMSVLHSSVAGNTRDFHT